MAKGPFRVLELLVTASPGGGPRHVWDLARRIPNDEFELIIGAPRDGGVFARFRERGLSMVELPIRRLGARHFALTRRMVAPEDPAGVRCPREGGRDGRGLSPQGRPVRRPHPSAEPLP